MPLFLPSLFAFSRWAALWPIALSCLLGVGAIFLLLPKPQTVRTHLLGALLGGLALLLSGYFLLRVSQLSTETVLFYTFSGLAVVSGALLVTQQHPARAALSFALVVLSTCGLFLLLAAPFLMAATIIIYAGAIIVTFLFVLMLASQAGVTDADARSREPLLATVLGFLLLGCLLYVLQLSYEKNDAVQVIDQLLAHTAEKRAHLSPEPWPQFKKFLEDQQAPLRASTHDENGQVRPGAAVAEVDALDKNIAAEITDIDLEIGSKEQPMETEKMNEALAQVEMLALRTRRQHGWLPAFAGPGMASNLSGPSAVEQNAGWRYDTQQRPPLPADNSTYLGRSLFTDFLLPVELGGVLLLVATIGAIAIAQRRTNPERDT